MDVTNTPQDTFIPQQTRDNPYDVTLVVEDGKEFKAHKRILSEASPFFEKMLNSGMRESKDGVVRLEMLTEAGLEAVLEFIYTGGVQISAEEKARDLIEMADYLFIPPLKTLAGRFLTSALNTSNCISTHRFAERYQCAELVSDASNFIHANFTNLTAESLNMSSEEVNRWISSDEIAISSEEDVFKIILTWIYHNEIERKKYFADLFRQVRLVYISRDYLSRYIVTNELVRDNDCCLELVKTAMKAIDSKNSENISIPPPRKSLETSVIVVCIHNDFIPILCYVPSTDMWYALPEPSLYRDNLVSCHGTLYSTRTTETPKILRRYDSFFDRRTDIPYNRKEGFQQIFVSDKNEDSIYIYEGKKHLSPIVTFRAESNSWEELDLSFDFCLREKGCIVLKGGLSFFSGGVAEGMEKDSCNVDRYNPSPQKWEKLAEIGETKYEAHETAAPENIYIYGGCGCRTTDNFKKWEVYNERTNEWQKIASPEFRMSTRSSIMCVNNKVYVMPDNLWISNRPEPRGVPGFFNYRGEIACYNPDKGEWDVITKIPPTIEWHDFFDVRACSMRVFAGTILQWTQLTEMTRVKFELEKSTLTVTSKVNDGQEIF